jgi:RimJ/RimL family protein N-acetyltransferase
MLKIRKAHMEDCKFVFNLRNDESARLYSFSPEIIPYQDHVKWFQASMNDKFRKIFIIEDGSQALGAVRFDINASFTEAVVSINISAEAQGKGVGSFAIQEGENCLKKEFPSLKGIIARVMVHNEASIRLFSKCSYSKKVVEFYKEVL